MKNKLLIVLIVIIIVGIIFFLTKKSNKEEIEISYNNIDTNNTIINIEETVEEEEKELNSNIKVIIDEKTYYAKLEDNETARSFMNMIPTEYNMSELNGNEKYIYLDNSLPTNSYNPKHIEAGDIMLFGNNCLVVFYKSFETTYSYTKIGHIDNLSDLGNADITIKFEL